MAASSSRAESESEDARRIVEKPGPHIVGIVQVTHRRGLECGEPPVSVIPFIIFTTTHKVSNNQPACVYVGGSCCE